MDWTCCVMTAQQIAKAEAVRAYNRKKMLADIIDDLQRDLNAARDAIVEAALVHPGSGEVVNACTKWRAVKAAFRPWSR
jgi:hypothetical protein